MNKKRTTENFPRMKDRGWARRNATALAIRRAGKSVSPLRGAFDVLGAAARTATASINTAFVSAMRGPRG